MMNLLSVVSIVDDDESVRESLPDLLKEFGLASQTFSSAEEFLASNGIARTQCLILDVAMPGMCGPELQEELNRRKIKIPIIFITGNRDEALRSRLIERGAIACLIKPFSDAAMLEALNSAFQVK
jgi:FixJ family two-component response regulator